MDVFAHSVFGVEVKGRGAPDKFDALVTAAYKRLADEAEAAGGDASDAWDDLDPQDRWQRAVDALDPKFVAKVRATLGAPPEARFFLVDEDDEMPGRSATASGTWLLGVGVFDALHLVRKHLWPDAKRKPKVDLHSWVTAS